MAGAGGGAWKVAYADFVTAMMAFFLVMWITAQGKPVKEAIAQYFQDPFGVSKGAGAGAGSGPGKDEEGSTLIGPLRSGQGPGRGAKKGYIRSSRKEDSKDPPVTKPGLFVMHDGSDSRTGTIVLFAEDSANLDSNAEHQLSELIPVLVGKANKIEIRGHASRRPLPPENPLSNPWQLSYARCLSAMKYLVDHGIEPQRVRLSQGGVYEQTQRGGDDWYKENSRVEIFALNEFVDAMPGSRESHTESPGKAGARDRARPGDDDHGGGAAHQDAHGRDAEAQGADTHGADAHAPDAPATDRHDSSDHNSGGHDAAAPHRE